MASIIERNGKFIAQVVVKHVGRKAKTFETREQAQEWGDRTYSLLKSFRKVGGHSVSQERTDPITFQEIEFLPRLRIDESATGIYFLWWRNSCVYVGQSTQIHTRVREHKVRRNKFKKFDSYSWILAKKDDLDRLEIKYISMLLPKLNSVGSALAKLERKAIELAATNPRLVRSVQQEINLLKKRRSAFMRYDAQ